MALILKKKKQEHIIVYEEGDIKVKFHCNIMTDGQIRRMTQKNLEVRGDEQASINICGFNDDKLDAVIKRWEGIEDENGKPVQCNRSNKIAFYEAYPEIIDTFLFAKIEELMEKNQEVKEEEEKN